MRAGRLRTRIIIQKQTVRRDKFGQLVNEWLEFCKVRAEIRDITGKEYLSSQAEQAIVDCKILIRYRDDITSDMRVLCNGVYYDIKSILSNIKKTQLELITKKKS